MLHLMGVAHKKLNFYHNGIERRRLTDTLLMESSPSETLGQAREEMAIRLALACYGLAD